MKLHSGDVLGKLNVDYREFAKVALVKVKSFSFSCCQSDMIKIVANFESDKITTEPISIVLNNFPYPTRVYTWHDFFINIFGYPQLGEMTSSFDINFSRVDNSVKHSGQIILLETDKQGNIDNMDLDCNHIIDFGYRSIRGEITKKTSFRINTGPFSKTVIPLDGWTIGGKPFRNNRLEW